MRTPPTLITNSYRESKESNGYNYKLSFTSDFDGYAIIEFGTKEGVSNFDCFVQTLIDSVKVDKRPFLNSWNRYMLPVAEGNQVNVDVYIANTTTPGQIVSFNAYKILSDLNSVKLESYTPTVSGLGVPTGTILSFAGSTVPTGFLFCDGTAVSRTDYADLFTVIGITYGEGDGETTFNLPNLIDKFIEGGSVVGEEKEAGLPNITGSFYPRVVKANNNTGAFYNVGSNTSLGVDSSTLGVGYIHFDASRSNPIYGNSTTVQPPALTMKMIIKY